MKGLSDDFSRLDEQQSVLQLTERSFDVQNECEVSLNTVENLESFLADINSGRWDQVLPTVAQLKLPRRKLEELYEQVMMTASHTRCNSSLQQNMPHGHWQALTRTGDC